MLNPTPVSRLCDSGGRPYFLWDCDLTLEEFRARLVDADVRVRAFHLARLMRQAKPDDVFLFVSERQLRALWPHAERYLGTTRPFWTWLLAAWNGLRHEDG
jgi:hypothetical protein